MKKIIISVVLIIIILVLYNSSSSFIIPKEAIRFRIVANSNNPSDQLIKEKLRKDLEPIIENMLHDVTNVEEARISINENIESLDNEVKRFLNDNSYNTNYKISFGNNYFPKKIYKGTLYQEGDYESLVITLGEGDGNNWWCLLFPPICYMDFDDTDEVEYKFLIEQIFDKLK